MPSPLNNIAKKWKKPIMNWNAAMARFAILFEDRLPRPFTQNSLQALPQMEKFLENVGRVPEGIGKVVQPCAQVFKKGGYLFGKCGYVFTKSYHLIQDICGFSEVVGRFSKVVGSFSEILGRFSKKGCCLWWGTVTRSSEVAR